MERSILSQIAEQEFALAAKTAILSFIIVFGIVKAITSYYTGALANKYGRKTLLVVAFLTGWIASEYGIRPYPFYIGIGLVFLGLFGSVFFIKDTKHHVAKETVTSNIPKLQNIFWDTTWKNKNLGSVTQAGLINNLNDGMV